MKNATLHLVFAAAALAVAAGSASAQTYRAEIPRSFHVGNMNLLPGSYSVEVRYGLTGLAMVDLSNLDTGTKVTLAAPVKGDAPKAWRDAGKPMIAFDCVEGSCSMSRLWTGSDSAYIFPHARSAFGKSEAALIVLVPLNR